LVAFWLLITIVSGFEPSSSQRRGQTRMVEANDGSCEISVPASWADAPDLSKEAVLGGQEQFLSGVLLESGIKSAVVCRRS
jgi:hypothetical protein